MMSDKEYKAQMGFVFVSLYNTVNYPKSMGNAKEQALGTKKFRQSQALFRKYTNMDGALKE